LVLSDRRFGHRERGKGEAQKKYNSLLMKNQRQPSVTEGARKTEKGIKPLEEQSRWESSDGGGEKGGLVSKRVVKTTTEVEKYEEHMCWKKMSSFMNESCP